MVVLPTPPFWLAMAMMRARRGAAAGSSWRRLCQGRRATSRAAGCGPRVGDGSACGRAAYVQAFAASVNSVLDALALQEEADRPSAEKRCASRAVRQAARGPARSRRRPAAGGARSIRACARWPAAPVRAPPRAGRRPCAGRLRSRWTSRRHAGRIARTRPGKPAPVPRSTSARAGRQMRQKLRRIAGYGGARDRPSVVGADQVDAPVPARQQVAT